LNRDRREGGRKRRERYDRRIVFAKIRIEQLKNAGLAGLKMGKGKDENKQTKNQRNGTC
jgi:hypothetical protein